MIGDLTAMHCNAASRLRVASRRHRPCGSTTWQHQQSTANYGGVGFCSENPWGNGSVKSALLIKSVELMATVNSSGGGNRSAES